MKNYTQKISIIAILLFAFNILSAQSPHKFSYQAVVRDATFKLVVSKPIGMKISILQGSATGTVVYAETQTPSTNANGLATVEIGSGTVVSGVITTINWTAGPYFIKTETDPAGGTTYTITSTAQLLSVPYALYSATSGSSTPGPTGPTGPAGVAGPMGPQGPAGVLPVNCLQCHNHDINGPTYEGSFGQKRDRAKESYKYSFHANGPHNLYAGMNASCAYCHSHEGFDNRMDNNAVPTYTFNAGLWTYTFSASAAASSALPASPGKISCFTCHSGNSADSMSQRTSQASNYRDSVAIVLWASPWNAKWGKITQDKKSHTCLACHQARPATYNTTAGYGNNLLDSLLINDTQLIWDSTKTTAAGGNKLSFGWRSGGHYGWPGNIFLGKGYGPNEIAGPTPYTNSAHTTQSSCVDCHMSTPTTGSDVSTGEIQIYSTGGHTFSAVRSYKGCNVAGCHDLTTGTTLYRNMSATQTFLVALRANNKAKLDSLGELLKFNGRYLMNVDTVAFNEEKEEGNLWWKWSTKHYNGYPDIYDATENKTGIFKATNASPGAGFYKWPNMTKGQFACLMIMQACVREASGGVHNPKYTNALLSNAIAYMKANPIQ